MSISTAAGMTGRLGSAFLGATLVTGSSSSDTSSSLKSSSSSARIWDGLAAAFFGRATAVVVFLVATCSFFAAVGAATVFLAAGDFLGVVACFFAPVAAFVGAFKFDCDRDRRVLGPSMRTGLKMLPVSPFLTVCECDRNSSSSPSRALLLKISLFSFSAPTRLMIAPCYYLWSLPFGGWT